jgi:hypothetical protein
LSTPHTDVPAPGQFASDRMSAMTRIAAAVVNGVGLAMLATTASRDSAPVSLDVLVGTAALVSGSAAFMAAGTAAARVRGRTARMLVLVAVLATLGAQFGYLAAVGG